MEKCGILHFGGMHPHRSNRTFKQGHKGTVHLWVSYTNGAIVWPIGYIEFKTPNIVAIKFYLLGYNNIIVVA